MRKFIFNGKNYHDMIINSWCNGGSFFLDIASNALYDHNKEIIYIEKSHKKNYLIVLENNNKYSNVLLDFIDI